MVQENRSDKPLLKSLAAELSQHRKPAMMMFALVTMFLFDVTLVHSGAAAQTAGAAATFIQDALGMLGVVVIAIGAGLGIWGIVNLLEGYGNDNPGAKSQGIKQLMAGGGLILIGIFVPGPLQTLLDI